MKIRLKCLVLAGMLAIAVGGCALSPQTLLLRPFIDVYAEPIGRDRELRLSVTDRRDDDRFGVRGGVYPTAVITPRGDVVRPVYAALAERLRASGFVIDAGAAPPDDGADGDSAGAPREVEATGSEQTGFDPGEPDADGHAARGVPGPQLAVQIRRIDYAAEPDPLVIGSLLNVVRISAAFAATARSADGVSRSGVYQANSVQRRLGYPSAAQNEELVNDVIAKALQQLLLDPELRALLAR